jgi:hypothetical protein
MKCYKVVSVRGDMVSCTASEKEAIRYTIGTTAYPRVGYLFVFDTYESALDFAIHESNPCVKFAILEGVAELADDVKIRIIAYFSENYDEFWRNPRKRKNFATHPVPKGTLFAKSFTPTSIMRTGI